jgi:hypothetical protein
MTGPVPTAGRTSLGAAAGGAIEAAVELAAVLLDSIPDGPAESVEADAVIALGGGPGAGPEEDPHATSAATTPVAMISPPPRRARAVARSAMVTHG